MDHQQPRWTDDERVSIDFAWPCSFFYLYLFSCLPRSTLKRSLCRLLLFGFELDLFSAVVSRQFVIYESAFGGSLAARLEEASIKSAKQREDLKGRRTSV